jgi:hypothetical protein
MADLIDGDGLSARVNADQLGHAKISMTQDEYMSRGREHTEVAALLTCAPPGLEPGTCGFSADELCWIASVPEKPC